ncbi:MAG: peptidoglycan-binding protein [Pseudonocardia sp.]|nr:peptidoglycan-binding protein [Pseudonocardia sp.]
MHRSLLVLGISVSNAESDEKSFGAGTERAIRCLQASAGLAQTGVVNSLTRAALDDALRQAAFDKPRIEGRLLTEHGAPAANVTVRLRRRPMGVGGGPQTADTTTDEQGYYRFDIEDDDARPRTVELLLVDATGATTRISKPAVRASRYEQLNLVVPASFVPTQPEWDRLAVDVERVLGSFAPLIRPGQDDLLAIAHQYTGWDARLVALGAAAARIAGRSGLDVRAVYALVRSGLPTEPDELAAVPVASVQDVLERAVEAGIVDLGTAEIKAQVSAFATFATATRRAGRPRGAVSSYGEFLEATGLDERQRDEFDAAVVRHAGRPDALWQAAARIDGVTNEQVARLRSQGRLAALTGQNLRLTTELMKISADPGRAGLRALVDADLHTPEAWLDLLGQLGGGDDATLQAAIPEEYLDGAATTQVAAAAYADVLAREVRDGLPTTVVGRMLRTGGIPVDATLAGPVAELVEKAEERGFSFAATPLGHFLTKHRDELVAGLDPAITASAVAEFERVQRLYRATPSHDALAAAVDAGFTSAHQIAMLDRTTFLRLYGERFGAMAEPTFRRARRIAAITHAHLGATMQRGGPAVFALSPTVETLLGEQDFCACEHCRSHLGPAAYFVDLLHFLDIDEVTWRAMPGVDEGDQRPFEVLDRRRPDLAHLPLTCENTTTELPYIDVVNEIMEYRVVEQTPPPVVDTVPSADLLAEPQSVLPAAYALLADQRYPLSLPFDLWLETVRAHLRRVGVRHADLLDAFGSASSEAVLTERLGFTPAEVDVLTDEPLTRWQRLYGYETLTKAREELRNARTLARRLGVSYRELDALVKTWFVNPALDDVGALRTLGLTAVDLMRSVGADGVLPFDADERAAFDAQLAAATRRFPGGTFDAAAWATAAAGRIGDVLVLASPDTECRFDTTTVRLAGSADDTIDVELVRLNLLVRLWRRLGWTLDELDLALRAVVPGGAAGLRGPRLGRALRIALRSLSQIDEVARRLAIEPRRRVDLLALRGPMATVGAGSAYARLFLSPRPQPVFDDPEGGYLTTSRLLADHRVAVQGALGLSSSDIDAVLEASGLDPAAVPLDLDTVSLLHRYALLATALGVGVPELITLSRLFGVDPFTATLEFLDAYDDLRASGLTATELDHLFAPPLAQPGPDPAVRALAVEVGDGVRRLVAEHTAPADPALLGDDVVARELGLVLPPDVADTVVAMWQRQLVHRAEKADVATDDLVHLADIAAFGEVTIEHRPDPDAPDRFVQVLLYRGVPVRTRTDAVKAAAPALGALLDDVLAQAATRQATIRWLVPDEAVDTLFGPAADEGTRRQLFADIVMPRVLTTLRRRFVTATVGSALATPSDPPPGLVEALLTDPAVLPVPGSADPAVDVLAAPATAGLTVTATDPAGLPLTTPGTAAAPATPVVAGAARIVLDGYLVVPTTGTYRFGLTVTGAGDTATLRIGNAASPLLVETAPAAVRRVPIQLRAGVAHRFTMEARREVDGALAPLLGTVTVDVGDVTVDGSSFGPAMGLDWRPRAAVDAFARAHRSASTALLLAGRLGLTERELRQLGIGALLGGSATGAAVRDLLAYVALRAEMAGGRDELVDVLTATGDDVITRVAAVTRRDQATVATVASHLGVAGADVGQLRRLCRALVLVARLGIGADAVIAAATPTPDQAVAEGLRDAVRAAHDADAWRAVATSINDPLRRRRRDALVAFLLHRLGHDPGRPEQLYDDLLLDPGTEPVVRTSRLRLAISCVQLFVQRCLLNLEPDVNPGVLDAARWEWMKRYRVWEANRKIFLFPENWLDPELRDDRTHLFTALTGALLEGDVTDRLAEDAFVAYLRGLADIARLEIVSVWQEPDELHVIGRTYNVPRTYYYRRLVGNRWTPWEAVGAQIEGDHVTAVVYQGRLHVFWVTFLEQGSTVTTGNQSYQEREEETIEKPKVDVQAQLHVTELISGQWTPRISSELLTVVSQVRRFFPAFITLYPTRNRDGSGADTSVTIRLDGLRSPRDFRFVSRNAAPYLVTERGADHSIGIAGHNRLVPQRYTFLESLSAGTIQGGEILKQRRPFTAVAPALPDDATVTDRLSCPFFYADVTGKVGGTQFDGQNTFFVERSVRTESWPRGDGWLPVVDGVFVDRGQIKSMIPPFVQRLKTGQVVQVPVDQVHPDSILERVEPDDWATKVDTVLMIGGQSVTTTGLITPDLDDREIDLVELEV